MKKILIAAISKNNVIGNNDSLPWDKDEFKEDLLYFRKNTVEKIVVYGYNTLKSLNYRLLPSRVNVVITNKNLENAAFPVCNDIAKLDEVINNIDTWNKEEFYIIGGFKIYKYFLDNNLVDELYITEINKEYEGDTYFPEYDKSLYQEYERIVNYNKDNVRFDFVKYKKSTNN
jgi:dihydrofolate reductase